MRQCIPREAVVTTDVGAHKIFTGLNWPTYTPNSYMLSNGLSSMGFGLPGAIAAARITRETTVCITGDGGVAMVMGELALLRDLNLPVVMVVMNDGALDLIRSAQVRRGQPIFGTEFVNPDFEFIARGFDLEFFRVSDRATCTEAIGQAVANGRPTVIEALIDPIGYPTTPKTI
jgi:acetolactate synthase-1/2/3 large subunit